MDINVILVATFKGKTWVVSDAEYDLDWETQAFSHISNKDSKYTYSRSTALLIAHNIQRKAPRERGVWEVFLYESNDTTEDFDGSCPKPDEKNQDEK